MTSWPRWQEASQTMAAGAAVGEGQIQRIIRDLHGTDVCLSSWKRQSCCLESKRWSTVEHVRSAGRWLSTRGKEKCKLRETCESEFIPHVCRFSSWGGWKARGVKITKRGLRRRKKLFFNLFKMTIKLGFCCLWSLLVTVYCSVIVLKYLYVILDGLFS